MNDELTQALEWFLRQYGNHPYSEIWVKLTTHAGKIKKIERGLIEKIQPDSGVNSKAHYNAQKKPIFHSHGNQLLELV